MSRLTEYHQGVAVIKGKRFSEAAAKLAMYEDWEEQHRKEIVEMQHERFIEYLEVKAVNEQIKRRIEGDEIK